MNVWRFFTKRDLELSFIQLFFLVVGISGTIVFLDIYGDEKRVSAIEVRYQQRLDEARAEIRVLKAAAAKRNGTAQSTTASLKVSSETDPQTPAVHAPDDSDVSISDDTVEIVHTGPLKGLPLDVAQEIDEEYRAASLKRAKRYHEWELRRNDHKERDNASAKKELAIGDALLANSKKFGETYLASFALMSPEALEMARKELLKTQPAEEVDSFFTKVEAYGTSKSREEINQEVQDYKETQETLGIKREELRAEREKLNREWEELQRTKPLPPNLGLDEFYTEWKKRNSSKPSP